MDLACGVHINIDCEILQPLSVKQTQQEGWPHLQKHLGLKYPRKGRFSFGNYATGESTPMIDWNSHTCLIPFCLPFSFERIRISRPSLHHLHLCHAILESFGCSTVMPINIDDFLSYFLMGAPFQSSKGSSMDTISQSVLLDPLGEEQSHFNDKAKAYVHSFNLVLFIAFSWCKCTNSFQNCSLTNPIATWKIFL